MTDDELMEAQEVGQIGSLLFRAGKLLEKLEARSGRRLTIFCESGKPLIVDADLDGASERPPHKRAPLLTDGGVVVSDWPVMPGRWDGGGW